MENFERVKAVLVDVLGVRPDAVTEKSSLRDDLGADSLDAVELAMAFEDEFAVEITDEGWESVVTVADAVALINKLVGVSA